MIVIRAVGVEDKAAAIKAAVQGDTRETFFPKMEHFAELPGSPFAYWIGEGVRDIFKKFPTVEGDSRNVRVGLQTSNDFRFLRAIWEVPTVGWRLKWYPYAKGGELSPFYAPLHMAVNWHDDGREMKAWADPLYDNSGWSRIIKSTEFYFHPGLTWPRRASRFAPQPMPAGCVFSVRGFSVFLPREDLLWALAFFNSRPFDYFFKALLGRFGYPDFAVGTLQRLPWPAPSDTQRKQLADLAIEAWRNARDLDSVSETSQAFVLPSVLRNLSINDISHRMGEILSEIDAIGFDIFGLSNLDKAEIDSASVFASAEVEDLDPDADEKETESDQQDDKFDLLSWGVGVAFGRFDIRLATAEAVFWEDADPFAELKLLSPGMRPHEVPVAFSLEGKPNTAPAVLVSDSGPTGIADCVLQVISKVGRYHPLPQFEKLTAVDLRQWFATRFFTSHAKRYSKSGRKAPIYWQLATQSASYSVWLYFHSLSRDSLFIVQDVIENKLKQTELQLSQLRLKSEGRATGAQRKFIEATEALVEEVQDMLDEVRRVSPLWVPEFDDGVILNAAPLWRLFPHCRSWQKDCKAAWDDMRAEKFDWARTAMRLWPDRVVPKCATDRSLAIAHGLEDVFWVEGEDGKWKPRDDADPPDQRTRRRAFLGGRQGGAEGGPRSAGAVRVDQTWAEVQSCLRTA